MDTHDGKSFILRAKILVKLRLNNFSLGFGTLLHSSRFDRIIAIFSVILYLCLGKWGTGASRSPPLAAPLTGTFSRRGQTRRRAVPGGSLARLYVVFCSPCPLGLGRIKTAACVYMERCRLSGYLASFEVACGAGAAAQPDAPP